MVDEVLMGCVLQGGLGQNVARQMSLDAGLPVEIPCMTINKVCGSGLRAVSTGSTDDQSRRCRHNRCRRS